jgi:hypothetical protein
LNDHDDLRRDPLLQTAVGRVDDLASSPTLCRFEQSATKETCWAISSALVDSFIKSYKNPPKELILDFDATDVTVHGEQIGRAFHGHYGSYCFLPLYVYSGSRLLVAYLRPGTARGHKHALAILSLLTRRLREAWPEVRLIYRGDSDFSTSPLLSWCDRKRVDYIVGLRSNGVLTSLAKTAGERAERGHARTGERCLVYTSVQYRAVKQEIKHLWKRPRRVLVKADCDGDGPTRLRFVVTSLKGRSQELFQTVYNPRGDMENRIKEQKVFLFADRVSAECFLSNQIRLLFSALAYVLLDNIRRLALQSTELARAQVCTIRTRLLKIGAVINRNTRRVRIFLSSSFPSQDLFWLVMARLTPD